MIAKNKAGGLTKAGFVLSILSLVFIWLTIFNIFSVLGIIFCALGYKKNEELATAGLVMSIIGSAGAIFVIIVAIIGAF